MNIDKKRIGVVASAVLAVGVLAGGSIAVASTISSSTPEPAPRSTTTFLEEAEDPTIERDTAPTIEPTDVATPKPTVEEPVVEPPVQEPPAAPAPVAPAPAPAPAPEPPAPAPYVPVKCPAGTVPGQVDANGDESLCQTPCQEWSDLDGDGYAETCTRP